MMNVTEHAPSTKHILQSALHHVFFALICLWKEKMVLLQYGLSLERKNVFVAV